MKKLKIIYEDRKLLVVDKEAGLLTIATDKERDRTLYNEAKEYVKKQYPKNKIFIWGIIPVPSPILVIAYAVIELLNQFTGTRSGVAHMTHLAGFAFAFLYFVIRMGVNPIKVWKDAYR